MTPKPSTSPPPESAPPILDCQPNSDPVAAGPPVEYRQDQLQENRRLKDTLTQLLTCTHHHHHPSSSSANDEQPTQSHLIFKPVTLESGHSVCSSACLQSLPTAKLRQSSADHHPDSSCSPPSIDKSLDHAHQDQSTTTTLSYTNVLLEKIVETLHSIDDHRLTNSQFSLKSILRNELECPLCASLLESPTTISCGHTFCRSCLLRARDFSDRCPICRQHFLMTGPAIPTVDLLVDRLIDQCLNSEREANQLEIIPSLGKQNVPLLICSVGFPMISKLLQITDPSFKLMIRRAFSTDKKFGIVIAAFNQQAQDHNHLHEEFQHYDHSAISNRTTDEDRINLPVHRYGTIMEITSCETLIDGNLLVDAKGLDRFRIQHLCGKLDGYLIAKVELFHDIPPEEEFPRFDYHNQNSNDVVDDSLETRAKPEETIESLIGTCKEFFELLKSGSTPWIVQRVVNTFGPMPEDPIKFSYWMATILPISDQHKATLLPIISCKVRLGIIVGWIKVLKAQWLGRSCSII